MFECVCVLFFYVAHFIRVLCMLACCTWYRALVSHGIFRSQSWPIWIKMYYVRLHSDISCSWHCWSRSKTTFGSALMGLEMSGVTPVELLIYEQVDVAIPDGQPALHCIYLLFACNSHTFYVFISVWLFIVACSPTLCVLWLNYFYWPRADGEKNDSPCNTIFSTRVTVKRTSELGR